MDRNKRPALTSPWKIGFLVSLLLVTVSIGVGFAITRTFGVAWSWLHIGDGSLAFDKDSFLQEMLPLVVMVPMMSLVAYFLITGAVRKYRAYLDSGLDYKHLVNSIQQVGDLEEDRIKALGDYPELRDFLLKLRWRIVEREKALDEKEAGIIARQEEVTAAEQVQVELRMLTGAIKRGPVEGFAEDLSFSVPEIKSAEEAIRKHLLTADPSMTTSDFGEQVANVRGELVEAMSALKEMIGELTAEMVASQNGAREIELYLNQLKADAASGAAGQIGGVDAAAVSGLVDRLDQASAALAALGEETRGVAINTALQAGQGEGALNELVALAEAVRDVAARFNGVAAQFQDVGGQVRSALVQSEGAGGGTALGETLETMSGKVTYWVERVMVMAEKLAAFEQHFIETTGAVEAKLGGGLPDETYQAVDDLSGADADAPAVSGEGNVVQAQPAEAGPPPSAGIEGLEHNRNLFEEIGGGSEDNLFADIPADGPKGGDASANVHSGLTGFFERNEIHPPTPKPADEPADEPADGGTANAPADPGTPEAMFEEISAPAVDGALEIESHRHEAARPPREDDVYDLYELGAVDYEPTVHGA